MRDVALRTARLLDAKTKPPGSLGRLEELAGRLAAIRGEVPAGALRPAIVVAAADHGVAIEGVSPYPQEVTGQMLANFATGGAAVAVLAREAGARLVVVDAGVVASPVVDGVRSAVVDGVRGTGNIAVGPAMSLTSLARCSIEGSPWRTSSPTTGSGSWPSVTWASGTRPQPARCAPRSCRRIPRSRDADREPDSIRRGRRHGRWTVVRRALAANGLEGGSTHRSPLSPRSAGSRSRTSPA